MAVTVRGAVGEDHSGNPAYILDEEGGHYAVVVDVGTAEWAVSTVLNVVLIILGIIEIRDRGRVRKVAQQEAQSDFESRRVGKTFDPYREFGRGKHGDFRGNKAAEIRTYFYAMSIGGYSLLGGIISFFTLYLVSALAATQSTVDFQATLGNLALIASAVGVSGLVLFWWGLHQMTSPDRRYILSYIAVWMGMKIPKGDRPVLPDEDSPKPIDSSLVTLDKKMRAKGGGLRR